MRPEAQLFYPPPTTIARTMYTLAFTGDHVLLRHVGYTLRRVGIAFAAAFLPGVCLGLAMGWSRWVRGMIDPLVVALHPIPKIALLPLFFIVLGIGEAARLGPAVIGAFFPIAISSMAGARQISPIHFEVAANYNASVWKVFTRVVLPGSHPMVATGARIAFNSTLIIVIAVELLNANRGLGSMVWDAWETMRVERLYVAIAVASALGILFNFALQRLTAWLVPWKVERVI